MIIVKIYGGLAGQMLQYSIGRALSIKYNTKLYLDLSWFNTYQSKEYPRDFKLDQLNTKFRIHEQSFFFNLFKKRRIKGFNPFYIELIREKNFSSFDSSILNQGKNIILDGYFFSYKYFESILESLVLEFKPRTPMNEQNLKLLQKIKSSNSVSVHFRRGDYKLTDFHGLLNQEYYNKSIEYIAKKTSNPELFVFSDEPDWVRNNNNFNYPFTIVDINKDEFNYYDIELMKNCKHNIIANSGFSWWGALLNQHEDKIVIAPKNWINSVENSEFDNIPEDWVKL